MTDDSLKVILVDDENLVRDLLKNCIKWDDIGMKVAGEASNAHEALDLIEMIMPDIIIADIHMPFMDGIEFSGIVIEKYPYIKILILTGYEEFEYAQKCVKVGVADFLLKPINDDEIIKALLKIKEKINEERNYRNEYDQLKVQLEESLPYLKEKFLNELLQGNIGSEKIEERMAYFGLDIKSDDFQVAVMEITYPDINNNAGEEERLLLGIRRLDLVKQYFRDDRYIYTFSGNSQRIVILNNNEAIDMTECCESLKIMCINRLKCFICIGIGNRYKGINCIRLSYKEACDALSFKVIAGKNQVINYNDINSTNQSIKYHFSYEQMEILNFNLKTGMQEKVVELIDILFDSIDAEKGIVINTVRVIALNVISSILNVATELEINIKDNFDRNLQLYDCIFKIDNMPDMKAYLKDMAISTIKIIKKAYVKKVNKVITDIQDYIEKNISNSGLSLSNAAREYYLNPSYLSRIFKQETGQTFVEYLTKIRMEKAAKLIMETDMKAYQIAEEIGITDPHYFSICFKKYTGMSVNDFKKA